MKSRITLSKTVNFFFHINVIILINRFWSFVPVLKYKINRLRKEICIGKFADVTCDLKISKKIIWLKQNEDKLYYYRVEHGIINNDRDIHFPFTIWQKKVKQNTNYISQPVTHKYLNFECKWSLWKRNRLATRRAGNISCRVAIYYGPTAGSFLTLIGYKTHPIYKNRQITGQRDFFAFYLSDMAFFKD